MQRKYGVTLVELNRRVLCISAYGTHVLMYAFMYVSMHACSADSCVYTCIYTGTSMCVHAYTCTNTLSYAGRRYTRITGLYIHTHVLSVCMHVPMRMYINIYVYRYICTMYNDLHLHVLYSIEHMFTCAHTESIVKTWDFHVCTHVHIQFSHARLRVTCVPADVHVKRWR